ncbi:MAG: MFS transporter [Anaerosomatales bacterium]|nr:MFS transporter [Anaerosomatales bacterium]MDT8434643.1 MFS transporter [Anaerosomatales bacterium]
MRRIDLFRVVAARFLSRVGSEAAFFVGVWGKAAFDLDATAGDLAVLMFALSVALLIGSAASGVLVDRYGPRVVLAVAEVIFVPAALAFIWADTMPALIAVGTVWALVGAPVMTAGATFAPYLTERPEELKRVNSMLDGAGSLSFVIGPAIGALIVRYANVDWIFIIDAVTSLAAAIIVWRAHLVRAPAPRPVGKRSRAVAELIDGMRTAYRIRALRYYVLAGTVVWLSFGAFGVLEPLFFRDVVLADIETLGWVNMVFGTGMLIGAAMLPRLRMSVISARGLAYAVALSGFGSIIYVGTADMRVVYLGALAWGSVIGLLEPLLRTLIHRDSPPESVGRVIGTAETHRRFGELLPLAIAPAVAGVLGVQGTMIAGALFASALALFSLGEARSIDRELGDRPVPEEAIPTITAAEEPVSPLP